MQSRQARALARRVHVHDRERDGSPLLRHIERVVRATPAEARPVAWLHEALERGAVSEQDLLMAGLSEDELRALRLVSHPPFAADSAYLSRVELIARAAGYAGHLARLVQIADARDRCWHPHARPDGWSPPYERALARLLGARPT
jgi:hypothetical protein